ncbi:FAD-binding oxidoreductase [Oceanomicrobium pacificus]|uniref:FAD-binding protein n=1 Tax=Oceanomicrobium pacificus TaxID=2692916 RepID=A0A6B0TZM4_9RHOB|nr:FAD-binding oxidoreductase [Oceanomicrobium pacificus]MXU66858.1 FAD-binding protein [Oceanomicrobium pacificus]
MLKAPDSDFLARLEARLGPGGLRPAEGAWLEEPRGRLHGQGAAVARPKDRDAVAAVVEACAAAGVGIVPYGGGTGLVGGQVQTEGPAPVILSLDRMQAIRLVDPLDNVAIVEAGAVLADVQAAAAEADRLFPLALASEGSCRIGGNLATNAGGTQVLRYGTARDLCLGVEAVMADGSLFHGLRRLRKDNTGYDLRHLLIGSEGTLGIITAAALKLFPAPKEQVTALLAVADPSGALDLLAGLRDRLGEAITGFELMHRQGPAFLAETGIAHVRPFGDWPDWLVLLQLDSGAESALQARSMAALEQAAEAGLISDAVVAQTGQQAADFWALRESIPAGNRRVGAIASHDISVPVSAVPAFIDAAGRAVARIDPTIRINCFGHLGDGNLHYNAFPATGRSREDYDACKADVTRAVHDTVDRFGGSFSAEHGVGRLKVGELERYGDPAKLAAMRAVKAALDPKGILNPGAVLRAE